MKTMKKLLALILTVALLLPALALADLPDVTGMTDQELKDLISACSAELMARNKTEPEGILLFEYEGVRVYQTDDVRVFSSFLYVPVAIYNDTDHKVSVSPDNVICNGWDIYGGGCNASGKAKNKADMSFNIGDADVTSVDQIESLKFVWTVYNMDTYKKIYVQEEAEEHRFW